MQILMFLFISTLEWLALIVLTFTMFKFIIRGVMGQLIFTSILLALLSYLVFVVFEWGQYGTIIQTPIVFLFFWLMFRVPAFYAGLMVVNGYVAYFLFQAIILYVFQILGVTLVPNTPLSFGVQSMTACFAFFVAWWLHKKNAGFTFVPDTDRVKVQWNVLHISMLILTVLGYIAISFFMPLYQTGNLAFFILVISTIVYGFLQYFVIQKEYVHI